ARGPFWRGRFGRLSPVSLLGFVLAAPFVIEWWSPPHAAAGAASRLWLIGPAALTLTQAWLPQWALAWNSPGWSLSAEAFFYLLFPFVALPISRLTSRQTLLAVVGFWLLSLLARGWCVWARPPDFWVKVVQFNPLVRLPEFLLGVTLGRLFLLRELRNHQQAPWFCRRALTTSALLGIV